MHWLILVFMLGWFVFSLLVSFVLRRMTGMARGCFGFLFGLLSIAVFATAGYVAMEFVVNRGPDDIGALWHAGYPLSAKYGKARETSYELKSFTKDGDGSGSGTYHIRYRYDGHVGVLDSHYDQPTHKFDHDEVDPR